MNKIRPFAFVITFWGLFYLGTNYPGAGESIAFVAVVSLLLFVLFNFKSYLLKIIGYHK